MGMQGMLFFVLPIGVLALIFVPVILRAVRKQKAERQGKVMIGTVRSITQTGIYENYQPQLRVVLDVQDANGASGQATLKQVFPVGSVPSVGQQLAVVINPKDAGEAFLANQSALSRPDDRTAQLIRTAAAVPANMRQDKPQVGDITAITPVADGNESYQISVVRVGQPPSPVFCTQSFPEGRPYAVGDRVYLVTDGEDPPRTGYIMPLSYSGGQKLPNSGNRTDGVVLADALLFGGAKGMGTILSATQLPISPQYASHGVSKWELEMQVLPADGSPAYEGKVGIGVSTPEKAAAISQVGATIPVRYDPYDRLTYVIDSIALGWGDPSLARKQLAQWAAEAASTPGTQA
ncbi:hypothetical protein [Terriglobus sp.]|uniref:hypothetical protein n=1 Tax=Terriglobus sp. TaxID=1889013 RepID=UPI003AFFB342